MAAAYAALTSLINTINQIQHHSFPPISLNVQQVESLTEHVTFFEEFLEGYKSPAADTDEADPLEMRIADAAHVAEDFIDSHIVDMIELRRSTATSLPIVGDPPLLLLRRSSSIPEKETTPSLFDFFGFRVRPANDGGKTKSPLSLYQDLGKVIEDMNSIKKDAMEIKNEKTKVVETHPSESRSSIMVGLDDVILEVLDKLTGGHDYRQVIPIVGMGGIGKTTVAKTVFGNILTKEHFDIRAWATISQEYSTEEILCELLSQVYKKSKEELSIMREGELVVELHKCLSYRRFLIVLDDMWSILAWERIQQSFPDYHNSSRIVVTTRISTLGFRLDKNYCLKMKFLDEVSSWDLFTKHAFGEEESCPLELEEIGKQIVENCRGLPLAIVVVEGLLKRM